MKTMDAIRAEADEARAAIREDLEGDGQLGLNELLKRHNGDRGRFTASVVHRAVLDMIEDGEAQLTDNFQVRLLRETDRAQAIGS